MANIYYNEQTGLPEFKVSILGICFTVVILLLWIFVKVALFVVSAPFSSGVDNKTIKE